MTLSLPPADNSNKVLVMSKKEARYALGELFIMGFNGLELSESTSTFISKSQIGGVILFAHNYESPGQLAELTNEIQECRNELPLWVSVDHEGGRVQRFKRGFTRIPDAATIASLGSPKLAFEIAEIMSRELSAAGINVNFCPSADIMTNPKNPVIGNRSFGSTEDVVSKFCTAVVRGHLVNGVQPCVKHFPGHGNTSTDSHFALPKIDTPLETLKEREFKPFLKAIKSKCSMVMTAHILNPAVDSELPATLSKKVLQDILRAQLGYKKVIVSDDMEMKAITDHFGAEEAPVMALEAGCDHLIFRSEAAAEIAYSACLKAIDKGKLRAQTVLKAAERIRSLKSECLNKYQPITISEVGKQIGVPEHLAFIHSVEERAVSGTTGGSVKLVSRRIS